MHLLEVEHTSVTPVGEVWGQDEKRCERPSLCPDVAGMAVGTCRCAGGNCSYEMLFHRRRHLNVLS